MSSLCVVTDREKSELCLTVKVCIRWLKVITLTLNTGVCKKWVTASCEYLIDRMFCMANEHTYMYIVRPFEIFFSYECN